jgi:hypothetical protein
MKLFDVYTGDDLVAVILGKEQAEELVSQLSQEFPECASFRFEERNLKQPFIHWHNASFIID